MLPAAIATAHVSPLPGAGAGATALQYVLGMLDMVHIQVLNQQQGGESREAALVACCQDAPLSLQALAVALQQLQRCKVVMTHLTVERLDQEGEGGQVPEQGGQREDWEGVVVKVGGNLHTFSTCPSCHPPPHVPLMRLPCFLATYPPQRWRQVHGAGRSC